MTVNEKTQEISDIFGPIQIQVVRGGFLQARFAKEVKVDGVPLVGPTKMTRRDAENALLQALQDRVQNGKPYTITIDSGRLTP